jgi:hypothetical protein
VPPRVHACTPSNTYTRLCQPRQLLKLLQSAVPDDKHERRGELGGRRLKSSSKKRRLRSGPVRARERRTWRVGGTIPHATTARSTTQVYVRAGRRPRRLPSAHAHAQRHTASAHGCDTHTHARTGEDDDMSQTQVFRDLSTTLCINGIISTSTVHHHMLGRRHAPSHTVHTDTRARA